MKIVLLATPGLPTDILVNWLRDAGFPPAAILMEPAQSRRTLLRGRCRRLGLRAVLGQLAFMALIPPWLRCQSVARRAEILRQYGLRTDQLSDSTFTPIPSVNAPDSARLLRELAPDVVILNGTRIVNYETLAAAGCPVLNIHAGITPAYRGVHGGYWALWQGNPQDFGATLHLVDCGVDTGAVLAQTRPEPTPADNFTTYPLIQLASALPALTICLEQISASQTLRTLTTPPDPNRQWYHPTLWQYLSRRWGGLR